MKKIASLFILFLAFGVSALPAAEFKEGVGYLAIEPAPPVGSGDEVEVVEFFWYGCPHCYRLEPHMVAWLKHKPDNVKFVRVPILFRGAAQLHARAYYALQLMGELERVHEDIFKAMHVDKKRLSSQKELEDFLAGKGVDRETFRSAMRAPQVQAGLNQAHELMTRYDVRGVPVLFVDGRYRSGPGLKSYAQFPEVVDYLVDKVLKERQAAAGSK